MCLIKCFLNLWGKTIITAVQLSRKKIIKIYKRDNENDHVVVVSLTGRVQNRLFEKIFTE